MSAHAHPHIELWQRDEEGYFAELEGWTLRVEWHPGDGPGHGFTWKIERDGQSTSSHEPIEEIELAMLAAEQAAHEGARIAPG